ncbi:MAG: M15 family metallopeptidase [Parachlamydiaceae bacterium]
MPRLIVSVFLIVGVMCSLQAEFVSSESNITEEIKDRMVFSWKENNPIPLTNLRYITISHWSFDDEIHVGELVVHKDVANELIEIFQELFIAKFPIEKMLLIDAYQANDDLSMEDNNSSAFCSRTITGIPDEFSLHSYGTAIDINPKLNPFVEGDLVLPESGTAYLQRVEVVPGLINRDSICYKVFKKHGWNWGGDGWEDYPDRRDYQHFEKEL